MAKQWQNYTVALNTSGLMSGLLDIIILAKTGHVVMIGINGAGAGTAVTGQTPGTCGDWPQISGKNNGLP